MFFDGSATALERCANVSGALLELLRTPHRASVEEWVLLCPPADTLNIPCIPHHCMSACGVRSRPSPKSVIDKWWFRTTALLSEGLSVCSIESVSLIQAAPPGSLPRCGKGTANAALADRPPDFCVYTLQRAAGELGGAAAGVPLWKMAAICPGETVGSHKQQRRLPSQCKGRNGGESSCCAESTSLQPNLHSRLLILASWAEVTTLASMPKSFPGAE